MRKLLKAIKLILLCLLAVLVLLVGVGLTFRAYLQHTNAEKMAIRTPNGIQEGRYVKIGGIDQWIQIRGQDRNNPVLLCLHGGPGASWLASTPLFLPWEKEFTVVQWDQRGTGKTLETTGRSIADTMSVDRMAQDGIEVAEFLRDHLHKDKIILLGFSWGSLLGIHIAKQRPDLLYSYVGTGQISTMPNSLQMSYSYVLEKAHKANDTNAVKDLENIGPPPFDTLDKVGVFFQTLAKYECQSDQNLPRYALVEPDLSLWDIYNSITGFTQVPTFRVYNEMLSADLPSFATDFQIPIFVLQGELDERAQPSLARKYFDQINSPHKEFVLFEGAGHFAVWTVSNRFLRELVARVRPLATKS